MLLRFWCCLLISANLSGLHFSTDCIVVRSGSSLTVLRSVSEEFGFSCKVWAGFTRVMFWICPTFGPIKTCVYVCVYVCMYVYVCVCVLSALPVQMTPSCLSHSRSSHSQYSPDTHQSWGEQIHLPQWHEPAIHTHTHTKTAVNYITFSSCKLVNILTVYFLHFFFHHPLVFFPQMPFVLFVVNYLFYTED